MSRRLLKLAAVATVAVAGTAFTYGAMGGWAVVTVEDLPEYVTAGKPVEIVFSVRQHGVQLMPSLKPSILAKDGKSEVVASAISAGRLGRYSATLVVPRAGDWAITINSGFMGNKATLASVPAIAEGRVVPRPRECRGFRHHQGWAGSHAEALRGRLSRAFPRRSIDRANAGQHERNAEAGAQGRRGCRADSVFERGEGGVVAVGPGLRVEG
jgi:hypothetical protein